MNSPSGNYQPIAPGPPPQHSSNSSPYQPVASTSSAATSASPPSTLHQPADSSSSKPSKSAGRPPPKKKRRSKVESACRFCRKSHMSCSGFTATKPCDRCIKREIGHLCIAEPVQLSQPPTPPSAPPPAAALMPETSSNSTPNPLHLAHQQQQPQSQQHSHEHNMDSNSMLNTLGLDIGAALRGNGANGNSGSNNVLGGYGGSMFGSNLEQHSPSYGDFNMALVSSCLLVLLKT